MMNFKKTCFNLSYRGVPPWDTGRPNPEIVSLEEAGWISGSVLDAGCGTGENALYLASRGYEVWGVDAAANAIRKAVKKAQERGISARFLRADALKLDRLGRTFDTVVDCGLFHTFSDRERERYTASCGFQKLWRSFSRYSGGIFSWLSRTVKVEMTGPV